MDLYILLSITSFWDSLMTGRNLQSESTLYICLNVKELLARSRRGMHRTDKYSKHSSIIWPVWLNG